MFKCVILSAIVAITCASSSDVAELIKANEYLRKYTNLIGVLDLDKCMASKKCKKIMDARVAKYRKGKSLKGGPMSDAESLWYRTYSSSSYSHFNYNLPTIRVARVNQHLNYVW